MEEAWDLKFANLIQKKLLYSEFSLAFQVKLVPNTMLSWHLGLGDH